MWCLSLPVRDTSSDMTVVYDNKYKDRYCMPCKDL